MQAKAGDESQGIDSNKAEAMSAQLQDAQNAIAEAAKSSNEAIARLTEQQERMLKQIDTLENRH